MWEPIERNWKGHNSNLLPYCARHVWVLVARKLDVAKLNTSEYQQTLAQAMDEAFGTNSSMVSDDIEEMWNSFKAITYTTAANVLGHLKHKNTDWFQEHDEEVQSLLAEKQKAHMQYLACDSQHNKMAFLLVRAKVQKRIQMMKDDWWNSKAEKLQRLADVHDYQGLFAAQRAIYGPCSSAVAPVKSADGSVLLTDLKDITGCWKEHFSNLLNQQGTPDERATSQMCVHTPMDDLCTPITMEELEKALQETRRGKAPGLDDISPEILKLGGPKLKACLLSLYNTCWQRQTLSQDFKDALIVMIYKRKGDRRESDNPVVYPCCQSLARCLLTSC